jgi:hypothetical protein
MNDNRTGSDPCMYMAYVAARGQENEKVRSFSQTHTI